MECYLEHQGLFSGDSSQAAHSRSVINMALSLPLTLTFNYYATIFALNNYI